MAPESFGSAGVSFWLQHISYQNAYIGPSNVYVARYKLQHVHSSENNTSEVFFNLTTHSTHFIYGYMASDIW